jgi:hypothetical protein
MSEQLLLFFFILLISAGFIVAPIVAVVASGEVPISSPPQPPLTRYDEFAGRALRGIGAAIIIVELAMMLGIVVPAERFGWISQGKVIGAAVLLLFASDRFRDIPDDERNSENLRKRRWSAFGLTLVAAIVLALTALRII